MDGNGRWATARGLPRIAGHRAGADAVRRTVEAARELGIGTLTLYAFSSDNWKRPPEEVRGLMQLFRAYLNAEKPRCLKQGIRLEVIASRQGGLDCSSFPSSPPNLSVPSRRERLSQCEDERPASMCYAGFPSHRTSRGICDRWCLQSPRERGPGAYRNRTTRQPRRSPGTGSRRPNRAARVRPRAPTRRPRSGGSPCPDRRAD